MVKTLTVLGARPQFIKAAPVLALLKNDILVHTGQHYDANMSDVFFKELKIKAPAYNLNVGSGTHAVQTASIMTALDEVVEHEKPDVIIVYGDTNSTLAGALVGAKLCIPTVHIEAGLRSKNMEMPEEVNRIVTDAVCPYLLCPTLSAVSNLAKENRKGKFVGDTMFDMIIKYKDKYSKKYLNSLGLKEKQYYLLTCHRPVNVDSDLCLSHLLNTLAEIDKDIVFPVHPRTAATIKKHIKKVPSNIKMIKPVGYIEMLSLTAGADVVMTDSGGLQKEAFMLYTPCITLREETEWKETIQSGWNIICGTDKIRIMKALAHEWPTSQQTRPFGDGEAAEKIVEVINAI